MQIVPRWFGASVTCSWVTDGVCDQKPRTKARYTFQSPLKVPPGSPEEVEPYQATAARSPCTATVTKVLAFRSGGETTRLAVVPSSRCPARVTSRLEDVAAAT